MLRVLLADDHPMYRYGLAAVLDQAESVDVVATVGDGAALLTAAAEYRPDVVITDLSMPDLDGVTATRELLEVLPELPVLVLTMHEDDEHVFAALRAGRSATSSKAQTATRSCAPCTPWPTARRCTAGRLPAGSSPSTPDALPGRRDARLPRPDAS